MGMKSYAQPSARAKAYIDSYLRDREASCHDIGRLYGVAHSTVAAVLRRWGIEQRYAVNVQKATIWAHRPKRMPGVSRQRERAKLKLRAIPLGEVAMRLSERRGAGADV